ncbi:MarR family winged helix-turn-helix transcriptional regulator [Aurantiacibacter suaedae]|uniref:MarR family winged helix-turn-helix transcriptional regulator n=1 Tax=Aurantiacibacter suaedae TaxID=2545755 RepID=UPI0010F70CE1|nr:MarR family winged helix-turn-helix transcriptional regulator [Aurantiacibacter suaedae]
MASDEDRGSEEGKASGEIKLGRLNRNLGFRLRRVHQRLSRRFSEQTRQFSFRSGGISALAIIEANPGISQSEVAREIDVDASIAVGILNDMRRRSLVTRSRLSDDRRRYAIELTESGRELLDEIFISVTAMEDDILGILTPSDLLFLGYILDKLYVSLDPEAEV